MMIATQIFGEVGPTFGGARLPNGLEVINRDYGLSDQMVGVRRMTRRAVGTKVVQLLDLTLLPRLGTWYAMGQRLGASVNFDQMQGPHSLWVLWKWFGRSGASPHQVLRRRTTLMTKSKTFVPYFKYLVVPL
ncbi:MAG: hypothetical protein WAM44_08290 [Chthoniobacterales bacterium]